MAINESSIVKWYGKKVFTLATEANIKAMQKAVLVVESDVKRHFTLVGTGRESKRGTKVHRASLPGQPPAIDAGTLRASIMESVETKIGNVIGKVGPDVEMIAAKAPMGTDVNYGLYLETGTSKMARRPYLVPALVRTRATVNKIFRAANS